MVDLKGSAPHSSGELLLKVLMTTRYKVHCQPAFHTETVIEVLFDDEGEFVRV